MKIQFWQADPNKKAMTQMEQILEHGVDQIAIASAFCTAPGVDFLLKFEKNLHISKKSFVVVAKDYPTDLCALNRLHEVTESVYVHLGCGWLEEKRGVPPLMHSKVILARQGEKCWLWTGSHNLTASAMLGLNCEAAVVVEGPVNNQLFKDALTHLEKCKDQAELYDPRMCEKKVPKILVVHAEAETDIKVPSHVHACFHETTHDRIVKPNTRVALFLYPLHTLHKEGMPAREHARSAYDGRITNAGMTQHNPNIEGLTGEYQDPHKPADYLIEMTQTAENVPRLGPGKKPSGKPVTQVVFNVGHRNDSLRLDDSLTVRGERYLESVARQALTSNQPSIEEIEPAMRKYFKKQPSNPNTSALSVSSESSVRGSRYFHMTR